MPQGEWAPFTRGALEEEEIRQIGWVRRLPNQLSRLRSLKSRAYIHLIWLTCQVTYVSPESPCFLTCNTVVKGASGSRLVGMVAGLVMRTWSPPDFKNVGQWYSAPPRHGPCRHRELTAVAEGEKRGTRLDCGLGYPGSPTALTSCAMRIKGFNSPGLFSHLQNGDCESTTIKVR